MLRIAVGLLNRYAPRVQNPGFDFLLCGVPLTVQPEEANTGTRTCQFPDMG